MREFSTALKKPFKVITPTAQERLLRLHTASKLAAVVLTFTSTVPVGVSPTQFVGDRGPWLPRCPGICGMSQTVGEAE